MRKLTYVATAAILSVGLSACASTKPAEVAQVETPPAAENAAPTTSGNVQNVQTATGPSAGSLEDFKVNVGDRVYFDLDQYRIDSDDQEILKRQAAWLQSYPQYNIIVAGNCDERGTREYNLALGERRASVVRDYLVSLGVDTARIETVSYGKERPLAPASNESAWSQNRNGFTQIVNASS